MTRITWLGHSTVLLETAGLRLLTDPVLRARIGPVGRRLELVEIDLADIDAVLISHQHRDHLDLPSLRLLPPEVQVIVPSGAGRILRTNGFRNVTELDVHDSTTLADTTIEAVPALHDGRRRAVRAGRTRPRLSDRWRARDLFRRRYRHLPRDGRARPGPRPRDPAGGGLGADAAWRAHGRRSGGQGTHLASATDRGGDPLGNAMAHRDGPRSASTVRGTGPPIRRRGATDRAVGIGALARTGRLDRTAGQGDLSPPGPSDRSDPRS